MSPHYASLLADACIAEAREIHAARDAKAAKRKAKPAKPVTTRQEAAR
jgi:hypothetical protein